MRFLTTLYFFVGVVFFFSVGGGLSTPFPDILFNLFYFIVLWPVALGFITFR